MANLGWAFTNCGDEEALYGPTGSVLFITGASAATGSTHFMYYTASHAGHPPNTLILSGNMVITGSLSASVINYENISIIDATGSTYFGNTVDDTHMRSGSLVISGTHGATDRVRYVMSASATQQRVWVKGFGGNYTKVTSSWHTASTTDYLLGITAAGNAKVTILSASSYCSGAFLIVKDEVTSRGAYSITLTCSAGASYTFDGATTYVLTGTMPAVNLYSNGENWFIY
jgi:hypothetical protein